jgi:serine/threonine protein kinase
MPGKPSLPFAIGEVCAGRYRTERLLGRGGSGVVYEAVHCFTEARVALKVLYEPEADLPERMEQEAKALAAIKHRYIVRVLDGGVTREGIVWFAMELLEGRQLRRVLHQSGPLPLERALRYSMQVAEAGAAVHALDIVHRDLKPENIFIIEPEDEVRVLDFGTAKFRRGNLKTTDRMRMLGTYAYLPPERLQGMKGDARCDVYALGHMLYEMLTGRHAFSDGPGPLDLPPAFELGIRQMAARPEPVRRYRPDAPRELEALVDQMLDKPVQNRPASMREVHERLGALLRRWGRTGGARAGASAGDRASHPSSPAPGIARDAATSTERLSRRPPSTKPHRSSSPDWLRVLRASEYGGLASLEAQAIVGAARFGCTEERGAAEEVLAMVLARDPSPSTISLTQDLCIAIVLGTPQQREQLRSHLRTWAYAPTLPARQAARGALRDIAVTATRVAPDAFGDDALRPARVAFGAAHMVSYEARDHEALHALYTLPSGNFEDTQLAQFGLLLMTRLDPAAREQTRTAIKSLIGPSDAQRDIGRNQLGQLLSRCLRPDQADAPPSGSTADLEVGPASPARHVDPSPGPTAPRLPSGSGRRPARHGSASALWATLLVGLAAASLVVVAVLLAQRSSAVAAPQSPSPAAEQQP